MTTTLLRRRLVYNHFYNTTHTHAMQIAPKEFNARPLKLRSEPRKENSIDNDHYMEKIDSWFFVALQHAENPTVSDFNRLFNKFERDYFEGDEDGLLRMCLNMEHPMHVRMVMASARFLN